MSSSHPAPSKPSPYQPASGLFAQLLAAERITVVVSQGAKTASFAPKQRILTIPNYAGFGTDAWMLFIAHEVGHAKFTPSDGLEQPAVRQLMAQYGESVAFPILNLLEDVRIERLMQAEYAGLPGIFARGYHALLSQDFFKVGEQGITDAVWTGFSPVDRLNIYAKVGGLIRKGLSDPQEIAWMNAARAATTWDEIVALTAEVLRVLSQPRTTSQAPQNGQQGQDQQGQPGDQQGQPQSGAGQDQQDGDQQGAEPQSGQGQQDRNAGDAREGQEGQGSGASAEGEGDDETDALTGENGSGDANSRETGDQQGQQSSQGGQGAGAATKDMDPKDAMTSKTMQGADKSLQQAAWNAGKDTSMVLPLSFDYLHLSDLSLSEMLDAWTAEPADRALLSAVVAQTKREAQPVLASMVNRFRAYQSAWQTSREEVSRTGAIDTSRLASYKLTDDIFLRRTDVPTAQNHGLCLTIDWSGSMNEILPTVLWQTLHLVWVAEQMRIPCIVTAFSDGGVPHTKTASSIIDAERRANGIGSPYGGYYGASRGHLLTLYRSDASPAQKKDGEALLAALLLKYCYFGSIARYNSGMPTSVSASRLGFSGVLASLPKAAVPMVDRLLAALSTLGHGAADAASRLTGHPYAETSGTPLYHAILSMTDVVREFRAKHRVEQCVSVFLTDGQDGAGVALADPRRIENVPMLGAHMDAATLLDPRSGKTFKGEGNTMLSALWAYHRQVTGAAVVVIDLTATPAESYRRVLGKTDLGKIAPAFGEAEISYGRRRRGFVAPKAVKQTKRNVVMPSASGNFADTGLMSVDRRNVPALGPDAYLTSHPAWWTDADASYTTRMAERAAKGILDEGSVSVSVDDEDEMVPVTPRVVLNKALTEAAAGVAMRRFADLLMPYLATGRDDAEAR